MRLLKATLFLLLGVLSLPAAKTLDIYFIDVEGGQATLIVSPSGESMLVDSGWPGRNARDADRILAAAKMSGAKRIDYFVATHYHTDHIGGIPELSERMPIRTFVDHGASVESNPRANELFKAYAAVRGKSKHLVVKPGDKVPIKGIDVTVLAAAGNILSTPLKGAGSPNPLCASFQPKDDDNTENAQSVGTLIQFNDFRMIDLGDLTWNKEKELVCPNNKIGTVNVYLTTHHGTNASGPETIVHALRPQVAIMNNGARKGGSPDAWQVIRDSPGLQDIWQLHFAVAGGKEHNSPDTFIANTDESCEGKWLKLSVQPDGTFTVGNSRNQFSRTYKPQN